MICLFVGVCNYNAFLLATTFLVISCIISNQENSIALNREIMRRFIIDDIYYIILVFENCKSKFTAGSMVKSNKFFKKNLWDKIIIIIIIIT